MHTHMHRRRGEMRVQMKERGDVEGLDVFSVCLSVCVCACVCVCVCACKQRREVQEVNNYVRLVFEYI